MKKIHAGLLIMFVLVLVFVWCLYLHVRYQTASPLVVAPAQTQPETSNEPGAITAETISGVVEQEKLSEVKYSYPHFSGLEDAAVEEKINLDIKDTVVKAAESKKGQYADVCGAVDPSDAGLQCSYNYDEEYKSFTQFSHRILSVRLDNYEYTGGAHGITVVAFVNYDLQTGKRLDWRSAFNQDSDYLGVIAKYADADLKRQLLIGEDSMTQADWIDEGSAASADNYTDDSVGFGDQGLTVVFQQYQVAAYAQGAVTVAVPYGELKGVIAASGPLG